MELIKHRYKHHDEIIEDESYIFSEKMISGDKVYGVHYLPADGSLYCHEVDIINKIKYNHQNYFDFSKNMIDIGAYHGCYSWLLPFQHSYAFEPNKYSACFIYTNALTHNRWNNITVFNELLSDSAKCEYYDGYSTESGIPRKVNRFASDVSKIISKTLDSFTFSNIGFIKVDTEGMDERVLRGGVGTIIRNEYPPILFESWEIDSPDQTQEKYDSIRNFLKDLGYEIFENWGDFETHLAVHKSKL